VVPAPEQHVAETRWSGRTLHEGRSRVIWLPETLLATLPGAGPAEIAAFVVAWKRASASATHRFGPQIARLLSPPRGRSARSARKA
jgi:hypothetical protein